MEIEKRFQLFRKKIFTFLFVDLQATDVFWSNMHYMWDNERSAIIIFQWNHLVDSIHYSVFFLGKWMKTNELFCTYECVWDQTHRVDIQSNLWCVTIYFFANFFWSLSDRRENGKPRTISVDDTIRYDDSFDFIEHFNGIFNRNSR